MVNHNDPVRFAVLLAGVIGLAACSGEEKQAAPPPAPEPTTKPAADPPPKPVAPPTEMADAPAGAKVAFGEMKDGAKVSGENKDGKVEVPVKMVAEGIAVKPAGAPEQGSGHHHILIDDKPLAKGLVVPMDATHLHFGKAQTETTLALTPGDHTLTLQFADGLHRSYGPELSSTVKITVEFDQ